METTMTEGVRPTGRGMLWTGRVLSAIPVIMFCVGGTFALIKPDQMVDGVQKLGWPPKDVHWLAILEIVCGLIYAIPQTAVLGAILLTGYLGGAVATHLRVDDPMAIVAVVFGIVVWLGVFLRDARLRALIPLRA